MFDTSIFAAAGLGLGVVFATIVFWSILWKGFALWIAAREKNKKWFIPMLFINTAGIVEIVYIFGFSKWGQEFFEKRREAKEEKKKK